ncbi:hypothetical protein [Nostoc sp.]
MNRFSIRLLHFTIASYKPHIFATHAVSVKLIFPKAIARAGNHRI